MAGTFTYTPPGDLSQASDGQSALPFPVYLINLERAAHRRRFALDQLERIGVTPVLVQAVDGRELDIEKLIEDGVYSRDKAKEAFSRQLSLNEIGCSLSHVEAYRTILARGDSAALILEDDALLPEGFAGKARAALEQVPDGWGVLHLDCPCTGFDPVGPGIVKYHGVKSLPVAASAYLVSRRGAELFVERAFPIRYPADSLVGRGLRWGVETYGVQPAITSVNGIFPTQIQTPHGLLGRIKGWVKNLLVRLIFKTT